MSGWGVYRRYVCREPKGVPMNQQRLLGPPTVFLKANLKVFQFLLHQILEIDHDYSHFISSMRNFSSAIFAQ